MEKFTTEAIEQYLEGKLDAREKQEMDESMTLHPELKEELMLQQALVKRMEHQALKTMVQDAHQRYINSGTSGNNFLTNKWILGISLTIIAIAGIFIYLITNNTPSAEKVSPSLLSEQATALPLIEGIQEERSGRNPEVPFMIYTFLAEKGAHIVDKRSGAVITIPPNILVNKNGALIKGDVTLKYREFRTQADIALSGIPMTYKGYNFNSAGMFEILALQNKDTLSIKKGGAISMDFVMTKNEPGIGFYILDKEWQFINSLDITSQARDSLKREDVISWPDGYISRDIYSSKDLFIRSMGYHQAAIDGKTSIPELPAKPAADFNSQFNDTNYKQIAGSDSLASNRILIKEKEPVKKDSQKTEKKESGFFAFLKKIFFTGGAAVIPLNSPQEKLGEPAFGINANGKTYTIYESGTSPIMSELASMKNMHFLYKGKENFSRLTEMVFYDMSLIRDTTVFNRFTLELKTEGKIIRYQLLLSTSPDKNNSEFNSYPEYEKERKMRMLAYDNRVKLKKKEYEDLLQLRDDRTKLLDSLSLYGNENIFRMARLIMNEDELKLSPDEWFASLDTNTTIRTRIAAHLDSIAAYGDKADDYVKKLAGQRKEIQKQFSLQRKNTRDYNGEGGHYFDPLVRNLRIKNLGIYNCDQTYLIQYPIFIEGAYVDEAGKELKNFKGLSLIDPKVNAAFSFNPHYFQCSSIGESMLLLFTKNDKIYFFNKEQWQNKVIKKAGYYTFKMKEITSEVKTSADLQKILEAN